MSDARASGGPSSASPSGRAATAGDAPAIIAAAAGLRGRVRALVGWRRRGTALLAGALSVLALAPFHLWPVLALTLPVLVWLIDADGAGPTMATLDDGRGVSRPRSPRALVAAAGAGWWFGFGYFLAGLFWVGEAFLVEAELFAWLLPFAVTLLPAGLALFHAAAAAIARRFWIMDAGRVVTLAATLTAAEWLRGHILTGFPWNVLGYALTMPLPLMQTARWLGIYGLTFVTVVLLALPLVAIASAATAPCRRRALAPALLTPVALATMVALGLLALGDTGTVPGVKLRLVQPSVPQREKWQRDKQGAIFQDHLTLSRTGPAGAQDDAAGITHVIWPEAAMPFLPLETPEALEAIGAMLPAGATLLTGALRVERPDGAAASGTVPAHSRGLQVYNSLIAFGAGGRPIAVYDKIRLVPFGEFLPLQPVLEAIGLRQLTQMRGGFTVGPRPRQLLAVPGLPPVAALVCYEALFPDDVVQGAARPGVIVNVTNDGWFGNTTGPRQHLHQARLRAVEEGVPIVRVANNGISAVIDPFGRITARLNLNVRGSIDAPLPQAMKSSALPRYRDVICLILSAASVLFVGFLRKQRNSNCSLNS